MVNHEIEAKFELLDASTVEHWRTTPSLTSAFSLQPGITVTHTDTYLDTPGYNLLRSGHSLRLRTDGSVAIVTVKALSATGESPIHDRFELEGTVAGGSDSFEMKNWPKEIRAFVEKLIGKKSNLQPLCTIQQTRYKRDILTKSNKPDPMQPFAELSIDEVTVYGPEFMISPSIVALPDAKPVSKFYELEIELKPGQDESIYGKLVEAVQKQPMLKANYSRKLQRALETISSSSFDGENYLTGIQPTEHMAEACRLILRQQFLQLLLNEAGTCQSNDDEYIHQIRVALRRSRVAVRLFADYFHPKALRRFLKILKRTSTLLGDVRDLDVAVKRLKSFRQDAAVQNDLAELESHWKTERKMARSILLAWLDRKKYADFIEEFAHFCQTAGKGAREYSFEADKPPTPYQVRHCIPSLLLERFERVRCFETLMEAVQPIPPSLLHLLRIECKYMRYSLEFAGQLLGRQGEELIQVLKQLQDDLGDLNDAEVSRTMLESLPRSLNSDGVENYATHQHENILQRRTDVSVHLQAFLAAESRQKLAEAIVHI